MNSKSEIEVFGFFATMINRAEELLDKKFLEFSLLQCHITLDYLINLILETNFLPKLSILQRSNPEVHKLFYKAIWEDDDERKYISFNNRFGDYTKALGFDFKGTHKYEYLKKMNSLFLFQYYRK